MNEWTVVVVVVVVVERVYMECANKKKKKNEEKSDFDFEMQKKIDFFTQKSFRETKTKTPARKKPLQ